jgi:hypothetical protein
MQRRYARNDMTLHSRRNSRGNTGGIASVRSGEQAQAAMDRLAEIDRIIGLE